MKFLREQFSQGQNIMALIRAADETSINTPAAILASYDIQAGSYVAAMSNDDHRNGILRYASAISRIADSLSVNSILEAGVGEATTLAHVIGQLSAPIKLAAGFDISWSRIAYGNRYATAQRVDASLILGDLFSIPIADNAFDLVYTSHSLEPNRGREKDALRELYRVARRYVILIEPASSFGNAATKKRIAEHKYCEELQRHAKDLGYSVIEHRLFDVCLKENNQSELTIIEKPPVGKRTRDNDWLACPTCRTSLIRNKGHFYCEECGLIYPSIDGIPCLLSQSGVMGTHFIETESSRGNQ